MRWIPMAIGLGTLFLSLFTYLRIIEIRFHVVMGHILANNLKAFTPKGREYMKKKSKSHIIKLLVQVQWLIESVDL